MNKDEILAQILLHKGMIHPGHWQSYASARQANNNLIFRDYLILHGLIIPDLLEEIERGDLLSTLRQSGSLAEPGAGPVSAEPGPAFIGPYRVVKELGGGGFGTVLRAESEAGQALAIKVLHRLDFESGSRFERELRLLKELSQEEGFVPLMDWGRCERGPYIVMPYFSGGTLAEKVRKEGPLPLDEALDLLSSLASAMGRAHERGILHRDLKPENILFDEDQRAFIADLGLGKHFHDNKQSISLSASGQSFGTPGYMPPEQMNDARRVGPQADVFALGAILYFSLTGERPFQGTNFYALAAAVDSGDFIPLNQRLPSCSPRLSKLVASCLSPSPELRPQNGDELHREIKASREPELSPRSSRQRLALALVLLSLVIAPASFVLLERLAEPPGPEPRPIQAFAPKPIEPKPVEPKPVEPKPVEPKPVKPKLVDPKPFALLPGPPEALVLTPLPPPLARPASWTVPRREAPPDPSPRLGARAPRWRRHADSKRLSRTGYCQRLCGSPRAPLGF